MSLLRRRTAADHAGQRTRTQRHTERRGEPLAGAARRRIEESSGADLSGVRVHADGEAGAAAQSIAARAFATGSDIYFGAGEYQPDQPEGLFLIAHEVAHTLQQADAPAVPAKSATTADEPCEREADDFARAVVAGEPARVPAARGEARLARTPSGAAPAPSPSYDGRTYVVVVDDAIVRKGKADRWKATGEPHIPEGTRVEIIGLDLDAPYVLVRDKDTQRELGWTAKTNLRDLELRYIASGPSYTYHAGGLDVLVFVPTRGPKAKDPVDVLFFFHGDKESYASDESRQANDAFDDNPARGADLQGAVDAAAKAGRNVIAICPQHTTYPRWEDLHDRVFPAILAHVLPALTIDLQRQADPLRLGNVSLAGHSHGGTALGQASADFDPTDVTLQDAGYTSEEYVRSWKKLQRWFCFSKKPVKKLRVISRGPDAAEHNVVEGMQFVKAELEKLKHPDRPGARIKVDVVPGDPTMLEGGMVMEGGLDVSWDGTPQAELRSYVIRPKGHRAHWGVRDNSMAATVAAGGGSFGETVTDLACVVNQRIYLVDDVGKRMPEMPPLQQHQRVTVTRMKQEKGQIWAFVGMGWVPYAALWQAP